MSDHTKYFETAAKLDMNECLTYLTSLSDTTPQFVVSTSKGRILLLTGEKLKMKELRKSDKNGYLGSMSNWFGWSSKPSDEEEIIKLFSRPLRDGTQMLVILGSKKLTLWQIANNGSDRVSIFHFRGLTRSSSSLIWIWRV